MKNVNNDKKKIHTHSKQIQQQNQHILSEKKAKEMTKEMHGDDGDQWK